MRLAVSLCYFLRKQTWGSILTSAPCGNCGGSGQTNRGGFPNLCPVCGGGGVIFYGPRSSGSSGPSGSSGSTFVSLMQLAGLVGPLYLIWPPSSWVQGFVVGFCGMLAGGFLGGLIRAKNLRRYLKDALITLFRICLFLLAAALIIMFIAAT